MQKDDNKSPGLAEHTLILGSGGDVIPNPTLPSQPSGSPDPAFQWHPSQGSAEPEPSRMAPRAKAFFETGVL